MTEVSVEKTCSGDNLSWLRIIKMLLVVIVGCVVLLGIFIPVTITRESTDRIKCIANLRALGVTLYIYAQDNSNSYPTPEKWCDLFVKKYGDHYDKSFRCPGGKEGMCNYAMNPSCDPNMPEDIVLLFESKSGWNQFGGPEILTLENHNGKGCNVLFNDGHREFVETERLGELNWDVEERDERLIE